ncbi:hypothetical protein P8452_20340 [Trifolium repens]|nr:hypothetical protein QL285_012878 [Trifolium repens]WJX31958.1 hypothetical protein P8452_20340 [Trifolium repens]
METRIEIHDSWKKNWMRRDLQSCFQAFKSCFSIMILLISSSKMMLLFPSNFVTPFKCVKFSSYSVKNGSKLSPNLPISPPCSLGRNFPTAQFAYANSGSPALTLGSPALT